MNDTLQNSHIENLKEDFLLHLGLSKQDAFICQNVKYVCIGGANERMHYFAYQLAEKLEIPKEEVLSLGQHKRYVMFLVGPVLVCSHGMGGPSISILLHEISKLLHYAQTQAIWIRIGTCGGIGVEAGTICITEQSYDSQLQPYHTAIVLGKPVQRPANFSKQLNQKLIEHASTLNFPYSLGKTMCCDDFYEGQARLDGAICSYTQEEKFVFLRKLEQEKIINIEMESLCFGSFCSLMKFECACITVCFLNRLQSDQNGLTLDEMKDFENRPAMVAMEYIKHDFQKK